MNQAPPLFIKAPPHLVYRCLVSPVELAAWWQCNAVVDPRPGGLWALGWSPDADKPGHAVVMSGAFTQLEEASIVAIQIPPITIVFRMAPSPGGTTFLIEQHDHPDPASAMSGLQTWMDAMNSMKTHVEAAAGALPPQQSQVPTVNVWEAARQATGPGALPHSTESLLDSRGSRSGLYVLKSKEMSHPVDKIPGAGTGPTTAVQTPVASTSAGGDTTIRVQDDGGFGISDPWAEVISWKKEQGFGYAMHPTLGEVMFDYDGCDFEPAVGDKVLLLQLKKAWNGKPKCKRIACPAKGSNSSK